MSSCGTTFLALSPTSGNVTTILPQAYFVYIFRTYVYIRLVSSRSARRLTHFHRFRLRVFPPTIFSAFACRCENQFAPDEARQNDWQEESPTDSLLTEGLNQIKFVTCRKSQSESETRNHIVYRLLTSVRKLQKKISVFETSFKGTLLKV
jgi:hypothetical protein